MARLGVVTIPGSLAISVDPSGIALGPIFALGPGGPLYESHPTAGRQALFGKFSTYILSQIGVLYVGK